MKIIIALIATFAAVSANALESHYGKLSFSGGEYHCTIANKGSAKNMKYVSFAMERRAGKERDFTVQHRVDTVVAAGETFTAHSGLSGQYIGSYCRFLAR